MGATDKEATLVGHVQVTLSEDPIKVQEANHTSSSKVRSQESSHCNCKVSSALSENLSRLNGSCRISSCSAEASPRVFKGQRSLFASV